MSHHCRDCQRWMVVEDDPVVGLCRAHQEWRGQFEGEWIPVSEPPKVEGEYLVIDAFKPIYSALYRRNEWSPTFFNGIITHWMPLPEAPKEDE